MGDHAAHGGQRLSAPADQGGEAGPDAAAADAASLEAGRRLFAQECRFVAGAARVEALPPIELPEVAFAGRSNVGKSSLVNALTGRRTLARVSNTPGRTQQLNFFDLGGRLVLVDLPGYGFARASKGHIKQWTGLTESYLKGRPNLRRICLLVDARHGLKASDRDVMRVLDSAAQPYQIVLTKADKAERDAGGGIERAVATEIAGHAAAHPEIIVTSAHSGQGVAALRAALAALALPERVG